MSVSDRTRRLAVPLAAFIFGLGVLAVALVLTLAPPRQGGTASVGGPFRLLDQDGRVVTENTYGGRPHLVFFGFTHCPDVCPTTLFQISEVLRAAGDRGRDLRALFVTVDPERDDAAALKTYLSSFDPRIVGLTGDPAAIERAIKAYRAYARKVPTKDGDYTMEHTALVYIMDAQNRFLGALDLTRPADEVAAQLAKKI